MTTEPQGVRFLRMVDFLGEDGCWLWTGCTMKNGYGKFALGARGDGTMLAHRFAYEMFVEPIPDGLTIDHTCRTRACVNPLHMEPVTRGENVLRGIGPSAINARKTHCQNGHEFTPENRGNLASGRRICLTCRREKRAQARAS